MTREHFEDIIRRRIENTGETREVAEAYVRSVLSELNSGQLQKIDLPDGSAILVEVKN